MIRLGGALLVLALLLAGCTTGGPAAPLDGPPAPPAAPTRPREIRIDGVDPCALLTEAQRAELGLDARPRLDTGPLPPYPDTAIPFCLFGGFTPRAVSVGIATVATSGIELFRSGDLVADTRPALVAGFPAVVAAPRRTTDFCTVVVDVAAGQLLDINFRADDPGSPVPQDQLCREAERAAGAAMESLLALR